MFDIHRIGHLVHLVVWYFLSKYSLVETKVRQKYLYLYSSFPSPFTYIDSREHFLML